VDVDAVTGREPAGAPDARRLLLVEDDRSLAAMLEEILGSAGYVVDFARDGQAGLHLGLTRSYDVMVLDRGLPAIEGLDLLGRLRANREPVLQALGVDLDERRLELGVVLADLLDGAPVTLGARVGDDDPVIRFPDLAQALQSDLDSHGCALLPRSRYVCRAPASGEWPAGPSEYRRTGRTERGRHTAKRQEASIGAGRHRLPE